MEGKANGLWDGELPLVIGGRYGLGSKEFNGAMAKAVFSNLTAETPKIISLSASPMTSAIIHWISTPAFPANPTACTAPSFTASGADGTVGANKNSIKIIGDGTDYHCQGYFVYDSKKSGSMTVSHLRFSPQAIRSTYLIDQADFVACHSFPFLERFPMLDQLRDGGVFLLNAPNTGSSVWQNYHKQCRKN